MYVIRDNDMQDLWRKALSFHEQNMFMGEVLVNSLYGSGKQLLLSQGYFRNEIVTGYIHTKKITSEQ